MNEITRETIERIRAMEAELQTFWGFRHLWAELVANHKECGVSEEALMDQQKDLLGNVLGIAQCLAEDMGITWAPQTQREADNELKDLIRHIYIHNGYGYGYKQMTMRQKRQFCEINNCLDPDRNAKPI